MKKSLLLGLGAVAMAFAAGAANALILSSLPAETYATATANSSHTVRGTLSAIGSTSWSVDTPFGTWNGSKFTARIPLATSDNFKILVDGAWLGYNSLSSGSKSLFNGSASDGNLQPLSAGTYSFEFDDASIGVTAEAYRDHDGYQAGDTIYIEPRGTWTADNAKISLYFFNGGTNAYSPFLSETTSGGFYKYTLPANFGFTATTVIAIRQPSDAVTPSFSNKYAQTGNLPTSRYTNCIWLPEGGDAQSGGGVYAYDVFTITIGETTRELSHTGIDHECTFPSFNVDDGVSITRDGSTITFVPDSSYANNINSSKQIKTVGISKHVLLTSDLVLWVDGYAVASNDLNNFCVNLLANTISEGSCGTITGTIYDDLVDEYEALGDLKDSFKEETAIYGNGVHYNNVAQEAYTRYCVLVSSGRMVDFDITIASRANSVSSMSAPLSGPILMAITFVSVSTIASIGAFFVLRRRRFF